MSDPERNQGDNQGEGNRSADRRYREATEKFVNSPRGREQIDKTRELSPEEQREVEHAEREAKRRAKEHDPAERIDPNKPAR